MRSIDAIQGFEENYFHSFHRSIYSMQKMVRKTEATQNGLIQTKNATIVEI